MTTTTTTLQAVSIPAEHAFFGQPSVTVIHTATHTALSATLTPATGQYAMVARMFFCTLSFSAAPATVLTFTVKDGSTVIFQAELSVTGRFVYHFDFSDKPLRGSAGAVLSANVGDAGVGIVQTISFAGDTVMQS